MELLQSEVSLGSFVGVILLSVCLRVGNVVGLVLAGMLRQGLGFLTARRRQLWWLYYQIVGNRQRIGLRLGRIA